MKGLLLFPLRVIPFTITMLRHGRCIERQFVRFEQCVDSSSDSVVRCVLGVFVGSQSQPQGDEHDEESEPLEDSALIQLSG